MLKELVVQLSDEQLGQLKLALEGEFTQIIHLRDGLFIGVNVPDSLIFNVSERHNDWACGSILDAKDSQNP